MSAHMVGPVTFDGECVVLGQFDPTVRWNGWLCPALDAHSVVTVLLHIGAVDAENGYDWTFRDGDLILTDRTYLASEGTAYEPDVLSPDADGLYTLGAWAWCWYLAEEEDEDWKRRAIASDIAVMAESFGPGTEVRRLSDDEASALFGGGS